MIQETCNFTIDNFRIKTRTIKKYSMNSHHFHDFYEIYYLNSGSRSYFIQDNTYLVKPGSLVLIPPNILHKTMDTGIEHSRVLINFKKNFLVSEDMDSVLSKTFGSVRLIEFSLNMQPRIESILTKMIEEVNTQDIGYLSSVKSALFELLVTTARYNENASILDNPQGNSNDKVRDITAYIQIHYAENLSLDSIAEAFFMSRYYLSRLFKKSTGFTLFEYLHSVRVLEAQKLLKDTNFKIIEIAQRTGFTNVSNFGKVFKSVTEMTPLAYRKMSRFE